MVYCVIVVFRCCASDVCVCVKVVAMCVAIACLVVSSGNTLYRNPQLNQAPSHGYSSDAWSAANSNHGNMSQPPQQIAEAGEP